MQFKLPKNDQKYRWTQHVVRKMLHYGLSPERVKRVIRAPQRTENGIAPGTLAAMNKTGTAKKPTEIWAMYTKNSPKIVITAWRYPGISPIRDQIPIPADILAELKADPSFEI